MLIKTVRQVFLCSLVMSISTMSNANPESESFNDRLNAHTSRLSTADHQYGYGFIARRLFLLVRAGKSLGLRETDLTIIRDAGLADGGKDAIRPFIDEINSRLNETGNTVELASLLEKARDAEQQSDNQFYQRVVGQLSNQGQALFLQEHTNELAKATITQIDYVSLAAERPTEIRAILRNAVSSFGNITTASKNSTFSATGGELRIDSPKRSGDE